jgi:putative membrane protein
LFELQSNKLAEDRGNTAEKSFAAMMVKDHTKTSEELKALVKAGDVKTELPTALDSNHKSKFDKLNGYKGVEFSSEFDSQQVSAHKDAVSLFERHAKGGETPKLKDWAARRFRRCNILWKWRRLSTRSNALLPSHKPC